METGFVTLVNTKQYPFNDSAATVAIYPEQNCTDYVVLTELVESEGEVGDIQVCNKAVNGFCIAFSGSARRAGVRYIILPGSAAVQQGGKR